MHRPLSAASLALGFLAGFSTAQSSNVIDSLNSYGYTTFASFLQNSSVSDDVQQQTDLTILALDNSAFNSDNLDGTTFAPEYYVLSGRYEDLSSLPNTSFINTLLWSDAGVNQFVIYQNVQAIEACTSIPYFLGGEGTFVTTNDTSTPLLNDPGMPVVWPISINELSSVLIPPQSANVTFSNSTFLSLLQRTNLLDTITCSSNITVFAPSDEAWSAVAEGPGGINALSDAQISNILAGHIVNQTLYFENFNGTNFTLNAINGDVLDFKFIPDLNICGQLEYTSYINNAYFYDIDLLLPNGNAFLIDEVLYPNVTAMPPPQSTWGYSAFPSASAAPTNSTVSFAAGTPTPPAQNSGVGLFPSASATSVTSGTSGSASASTSGTAVSHSNSTMPAKSTPAFNSTTPSTSSNVTALHTGAAAIEKGNLHAVAGAIAGLGMALAGFL